MARPRKCRKVCHLPENSGFTPLIQTGSESVVVLTVEEYEALRLIDKEGFSQEQCGTYMHIARTTAQQIYASGRRKLATALVDGLPIRIEGGNYRLCDATEPECGCNGCRKHRRCQAKQHTQEKDLP